MTPVIPTALVIPQGDNDCVIGYQNITVLNLSDLQKKNKKPMFMSRDVKNQLLQRSWCESLLQFHESVGTGMSVLEDRFKKGYYKLLGEFRSLAIEVIIERVDSFHRESFSGFGVAAGEFLGPQLRLIFLSDILGESVELKTDLWWKVQYKGFSGVLFVEPLRGSTTGTFNSNPICRKPTCQVLQLVEKLDKLDIQPWESSLLGEYIHVHGYCLSAVLGEMLAMAKMPHTKELLVIEILARTFKSFLRGQLREAIEKYHKIKAVHIEGALKSLVVDNYNQFFANFNTKSVGGDGLDKWIERAIFKFGPALDKGILKNALENQVDLRRLLFIINLQTGIQLEESFLSNSKVGGNSANHSTVGISLQIDNSCLLTFEVKNFQGKDKGMCQLSLYPFLRQMQHKGLEGLGLLTAVKTTGTLDMLTHDLAMPIYTLQETSPIDRYFENILEFNEDFIGQLERDSTGSSRRDAELMLDRVDLVASIYFQVYGLTDRRAAIWLYLISLQLFYNNQVDSSNKTSHLEGLIKGALELTEEDDYILQSFIKTLQIQHDLISNTNDLSLQQDLLHARILEAHGQLACMLGQSHPLVARFFQVLSGTFWFIFHSQINGDVDSRESETGNQLRSCRLPHSVQFMCTEWQRRAVQVALRGLGKRHGFTLRAQLLFGCYALFEGLFEDAICAFLETLNQVENNPTPVSNSTATSRNGGLHLGTETLSTSTNSYEHELPITFKADLYFALCEAYSLKGDIERALSYGKLAKSCKESLLGHEHPQTIQSYYQLGLLAFSRLQQERITSTCSPGVTDDISGISGTLGFWITGKVMTKQFTGLANLALGCFEKIFHFIKYQSVGTTRILKNSPTSGSTTASRQSGVFTKHSLASLHNTEKFVALSPVQMAVYSPINIPSSHNTNGEVGASVPPVYISSTCSQEFISLQLFEVSKKLLLLSLLLLDPVQRDTLLSIYRQYHQQLISDSTTGEFADFLCSTQKTVVLKLVAYSPITYFQTLLSSTGNSNSNNSNTDWLAERELMAIFALLESSSSL